MKRRQIALATIVACLALFSSTPVFSTWNRIFTTRAASSAFFFNEFVGFVGSDGFDGIFKTTDGGKTWRATKITTPGYSQRISQIFMKDALNGWATIEDAGNLQSILRTVDGGASWNFVGPKGSYNNIYET